jgi:hypothetical protein
MKEQMQILNVSENSRNSAPRLDRLQLIYNILHYNLFGIGDADQHLLLSALRTLKTSEE